jgi:exodeoxyribonuclease VII large subunit
LRPLRGNASRLDFDLADGQNVLVFGDVEFYRPQGRVQILVKAARLDVGLGEKHQELELLKERLAAEGLFDAGRKRPIPAHPACIGVVTSPDGAALRDVLRVLGACPARIVISPAVVQGDSAPASIASAISALQGIADVIIVGRGGVRRRTSPPSTRRWWRGRYISRPRRSSPPSATRRT